LRRQNGSPAKIVSVLRHFLILPGLLAFLGLAGGQTSQPQVKVNVLNVCTPSPEEKQEIASTLARVPKLPLFGADFEVDRGRSSLEESADFLRPGEGAQLSPDAGLANWVRIRREFSVQALFSTVQYSFSVDPKNMIETLVFRVRDPRDLIEVSIEGSAAAVTTAAAMLGTDTPASRIKLERFGKPSVVLARCLAGEVQAAPDQTAYEPLFRTASAIISNYRNLLAAKRVVPDELMRLGPSRAGWGGPARTVKPAAKQSAPPGSTTPKP
jgi:hypothetical protein